MANDSYFIIIIIKSILFQIPGISTNPRKGSPHNQPAVYFQHAVRNLQALHERETSLPYILPWKQHELINGTYRPQGTEEKAWRSSTWPWDHWWCPMEDVTSLWGRIQMWVFYSDGCVTIAVLPSESFLCASYCKFLEIM